MFLLFVNLLSKIILNKTAGKNANIKTFELNSTYKKPFILLEFIVNNKTKGLDFLVRNGVIVKSGV